MENSNIFYYYCNEEVFNSIIKGHKLWLTSIWDLNDPSEVHWTFKKVWTKVQDELSKNLSDNQKQLISLINNEIENKIYQSYIYYIICFSRHPDLLSQWRGYADDGRGFSVGINLDEITSNIDIPWFSTDIKRSIGFSGVIYNFDNQYKILLKIMKEILAMDYTEAPLMVALMNLSRFATIFKNPYYFEEKEVRLMCVGQTSDGSSMRLDNSWILDGIFEHTNSVCKTTHIELDLMKCNLGGCIESVVLGPKNKYTTEEIYENLHSNGFSVSRDNVVNSMGTYR